MLFDVHSAEKTYASVSIAHVDYRRTARSRAGLIAVSVWCRQVMTQAQAITSSTAQPQNLPGPPPPKPTQAPSGAAPVSTGTVQPQPATSTQQQLLAAPPPFPLTVPPVGGIM